ncbi:hypothetical protein [Mycobacterium dioxanotrophicus]|uniref:hypothetical protein n=1 Tax=Mycobacterium dioxanotrophicus TaxID=482462 RepID=UPI0012FAC4CB|nr:hypothetical protein [Mycobacterium dioxanotrophicus]
MSIETVVGIGGFGVGIALGRIRTGINALGVGVLAGAAVVRRFFVGPVVDDSSVAPLRRPRDPIAEPAGAVVWLVLARQCQLHIARQRVRKR